MLRNFGAANVVRTARARVCLLAWPLPEHLPCPLREQGGARGSYERAVKLCYGLSILGSVPLVILPFYNLVLPLFGYDASW